MKIFFGVIVIVVFVILGVILSQKYTDKKIFYLDFVNFNKKMKNEVYFSKKSLLSLIAQMNKENIFTKCLTWYFINKNGQIPLDKNFEEDKDYLLNYLETIGNSDTLSQIKFIESCDSELEEKCNIATENEKKYKVLYVKLAFLLGLLVFILII